MSLTNESKFNFEYEIYPKLLQQNFKFFGYITNELIEDMGTHDRLKRVEEMLKIKKIDDMLKGLRWTF